MRHDETCAVHRGMKSRRARAFLVGQQRREVFAPGGIGIQRETQQGAAGRSAITVRQLPQDSAGGQIGQRPNPEARRGSSGALSVSLL